MHVMLQRWTTSVSPLAAGRSPFSVLRARCQARARRVCCKRGRG